MTVTVCCMCALHAASHHWHTCRSGALGGMPRRRTVAASVAASVAAWPIEFNPRLSMIVDLSSSDAPKELLFPKGQVAL